MSSGWASRGLRSRSQPWGLSESSLEVDEDRAPRVGGQAERVGVGHDVGDHRARGRRVDDDLERVAGVAPRLAAVRSPDPVAAAPHVDPPVAEQQRDGLGGRRPQAQARLAVAPRRPEVDVRSGRIDVVEHAGDLHAGDGEQRAGRVVGGDGELAAQQRAGAPARLRRQRERAVGGEVREVGPDVGRQAGGIAGQRERRPADDLAVLHGHAAVGRGVQPVGGAVGAIPGDQPAPEPVRAALRADGARDVVADHVRRVVIGEGDGAAGRRDRDVGASRRATGAVVLVPGAVDGDLVGIRARRHDEGAAVQRPSADPRQLGGRTFRLPVAGAAEL